MTASPSIHKAVATKTANEYTVQFLVSNSGTKGMVRFTLDEYTGGSCVYTGTERVTCEPSTFNTYISSLYHKFDMQVFTASPPSAVCIGARACSSGDDCTHRTCSTWGSLRSRLTDVSVGYALNVTPDTVQGLSAVAGDGNIRYTWNAPDNAPVFCYYIRLTDNNTGNVLASGNTVNTDITASNLTNGISYTLEVIAVSDDGLNSNPVTITKTPVVQCNTPSVSITVT